MQPSHAKFSWSSGATSPQPSAIISPQPSDAGESSSNVITRIISGIAAVVALLIAVLVVAVPIIVLCVQRRQRETVDLDKAMEDLENHIYSGI